MVLGAALVFVQKYFDKQGWPERFFVRKIIARVSYQVEPNYCEATRLMKIRKICQTFSLSLSLGADF